MTRWNWATNKGRSRIAGAMLVFAVSLSVLGAACVQEAVPPPSVTTQQSTVSRAAAGGASAEVPLNSTLALAVGDRVSTDSVNGTALLKLLCAWLEMYGGSAAMFQMIDANGADIGAPYGATEISTVCSELTVTAGDPAQAVIGSHSTLFLAAYDRKTRQTLLWVQAGAATLANLKNGKPDVTVKVDAGSWSVVAQGNPPLPPRPVGAMAPVIDQMGLRNVYNQVVALIRNSGFGPGAPKPVDILTIDTATQRATPTK